MNNNPLGIFDSGIGGLSILKEIQSALPHESSIYFADSKNCPYGGRSKEEVYTLAKKSLEYLAARDVKLIVIGCNTVTVSCIERLRDDFSHIPIVGIVPVVKRASERSKTKRIGILSTSTTSKSEYQAHLVQQYASDCEVVSVGTDELVPSIERDEVNSDSFIKILNKSLEPFINEHIDTLALGCSHFPLIRKQIQEILGNDVLVLDSGGAVARQVKRILSSEKLEHGGAEAVREFITTGDLDSFTRAVRNVISTKNATIRSI